MNNDHEDYSCDGNCDICSGNADCSEVCDVEDDISEGGE